MNRKYLLSVLGSLILVSATSCVGLKPLSRKEAREYIDATQAKINLDTLETSIDSAYDILKEIKSFKYLSQETGEFYSGSTITNAYQIVTNIKIDFTKYTLDLDYKESRKEDNNKNFEYNSKIKITKNESSFALERTSTDANTPTLNETYLINQENVDDIFKGFISGSNRTENIYNITKLIHQNFFDRYLQSYLALKESTIYRENGKDLFDAGLSILGSEVEGNFQSRNNDVIDTYNFKFRHHRMIGFRHENKNIKEDANSLVVKQFSIQ